MDSNEKLIKIVVALGISLIFAWVTATIYHLLLKSFV